MNKPSARPTLRRTALALLCAGALAGAWAAMEAGPPALDPLDPLLRPAATARQATSAVLIAVTRAGNRLVAVGESGIALYSDDGGHNWAQAQVPVSVTLTAVHFATADKGWAVGHSGVVLATTDGGRSWVRQLDGRQIAALPEDAEAVADGDPPPLPNAGDPLLDVFFLDEQEGFALGAFGLLLHTADGGANWTRASARLPNPDGNHLYGMRRVGDRLYVVGERGAVFASQDGGKRFDVLKTPYDGSYFGVAGGRDGEVVVFGLQGRAFASSDHGASWHEVGGEVGGAWTGAVTLADGRIVMVGQAGDVRLQSASTDGFDMLQGRQPPLSAVAATADGRLLAVGPRGTHIIDMASATQGSTQP